MPAAARQALDEAQRREYVHRRRQRAEERGRRIGRHAEQERAAAAKPVAERAREELSQRQPHQASRERDLRLRRACVKAARHRGNSGD